VDHNETTFNIDVNQIESAITSKTKAIIPVHLYGQPAEMDAILEIAKKHKLYVIEDCSQAHLATYKNKKIGNFGHLGTFSFYPGKNLGAYGEAGAVVTNNETLSDRILKFRQHGSTEKYIHESEGHNYRIEEIQAAVLNVKLKYIENWTQNRISIANKYNLFFSDSTLDYITAPYCPSYIKAVYHLYVVKVKDRDNLINFLNKNNISTGLHYPIPLHLQKAYHYLNYKKGDFPVAEKYCQEILSLPVFPEMTDDQVQYVCETIKKFYT